MDPKSEQRGNPYLKICGHLIQNLEGGGSIASLGNIHKLIKAKIGGICGVAHVGDHCQFRHQLVDTNLCTEAVHFFMRKMNQARDPVHRSNCVSSYPIPYGNGSRKQQLSGTCSAPSETFALARIVVRLTVNSSCYRSLYAVSCFGFRLATVTLLTSPRYDSSWSG